MRENADSRGQRNEKGRKSIMDLMTHLVYEDIFDQKDITATLSKDILSFLLNRYSLMPRLIRLQAAALMLLSRPMTV